MSGNVTRKTRYVFDSLLTPLEINSLLILVQVLQENERTKLLKTASNNDFDPSATEKRLRFRLNDNYSVGNISDNLEGLEGISEGAASTGNLSVTSSCDDLDKATNEIEADPMFDNGSVSGRGKWDITGSISSPLCYYSTSTKYPSILFV